MKGFKGKLLMVDLEKENTEIKKIPASILQDYIGGKGLAAWILYNSSNTKINPLGPENPVIFASGPLTGTLAPATRGVVVTCSPLTNLFVDSFYGGCFAQEIKYAGFDAIVITGKAQKPVYLKIEDENIEFLPANKYWGMDTFEVNESIKEDLEDDSYKIACIGPAGENQIPYALVSCEYNRQAGRGGVGAVLGSKNLKAIAIKGTKTIEIANREKFYQAVDKAIKELKESEDIQALTKYGTAASLWAAHEEGLLPVYNYQKGTFNPAGLAQEAQKKEIWLRNVGCASCPISCSKIGVIRRGKRKGTVSDIVEYETAALMGTNLGLDDIREVAYLVYLCDALGLDGMSAGSVIGFAMECFEIGLLKEEEYEGIKLAFSSPDNIEKVLKQIAYRKGALGNLLAEGTKKAGIKLGKEGELRAVHVKGMEVPAWGPRGVPAMGLAYLTADRGACHQRAFPINYELGYQMWKGKKVDRLAVEGKAEMLIHDQNYSAALDTFVKCDFGTFGISKETYLSIYEGVTGDVMDENRLMSIGERIWNITRLFNIRQGMSLHDEKLPKRFYQPLPDGPAKGHSFTDKDEEIMLKEYYALRGWNTKGIPTKKKLNQLNIKEVN